MWIILLIISIFVIVETSRWAHIKLDPVIWEELPLNEDGERILSCNNYDPETNHRYRWRFNGSSILPKQINIRRDKLLFNRSLNAYRNLLIGEYSCCIQESLGKACYVQHLQVKNPSIQIGVDLSDIETLYAQIGNSYNIRLAKENIHEGIHCSVNNQTIPKNVYYLSQKNKKGRYYHIKISYLTEENVGNYECTLSRHKKDNLNKTFLVTLEGEYSDPSSSTTYTNYFLFVCIFNYLALELVF